MNNNKNVKKITRNELVKSVSQISDVSMSDMKCIFDNIESAIIRMLKDVTADEDVSIKVFDGFSIKGTYVPGGERKNNLTGEVINVDDRIRASAKIARCMQDKING